MHMVHSSYIVIYREIPFCQKVYENFVRPLFNKTIEEVAMKHHTLIQGI